MILTAKYTKSIIGESRNKMIRGHLGSSFHRPSRMSIRGENINHKKANVIALKNLVDVLNANVQLVNIVRPYFAD